MKKAKIVPKRIPVTLTTVAMAILRVVAVMRIEKNLAVPTDYLFPSFFWVFVAYGPFVPSN